MHTINTIDDYLRALQHLCAPERARGKHFILQFEFSGSQSGPAYAVVEDATLQVAHGVHPDPTVIVRVDFDLWMRVVRYEEDPLLTYQEGRYSIVGDVDALLESDTWFPRNL